MEKKILRLIFRFLLNLFEWMGKFMSFIFGILSLMSFWEKEIGSWI